MYLPPYTIDHLPDLEEALNHFPGSYYIIVGGFKTNTGRLQNPQSQQVAYLMASFGLFGLLGHFRKRLQFRHMKTWWQFRQGKLLCSRCDYVLGLDRRLLGMVGIRDPRNFSYDPFELCARLLQ